MEKSAKMVLVLALFLAALSAVPSEGRSLPKPEKPAAKAYHPQNFIGGFGGGVFSPGAPPLIGGGTVYGPLVPGFGFGGSPYAGGFPGIGSQPIVPGGGLGGGIGGVGHP